MHQSNGLGDGEVCFCCSCWYSGVNVGDIVAVTVDLVQSVDMVDMMTIGLDEWWVFGYSRGGIDESREWSYLYL